MHQAPRNLSFLKTRIKDTLGRIEGWKPEKGETFFYPNPRHPSFDHTEANTKKKTTPRDNNQGGRRFFQKHKICARFLVSEQTTSQRPTERREPFSPELPPTPVTLKQRAVRKGGRHFSPKNTTLTLVTFDGINSRTRRIREMFFLSAQQSISKDAHNKAPRRTHFVEHREGQIKSPKQT